MRGSFLLLATFATSACAAPVDAPKPAPEPVVEESPEPEAPQRKTRGSRPKPKASIAPRPDPTEPVPLAEAAPAVAKSNRCVTGRVQARGDIVVPVKNAKVSLFMGAALLGETRTDGNGKFAWCAGANLSGERFEVTVRVSKAPFQTISQSRDWKVGTQEEFDFAMTAEGF